MRRGNGRGMVVILNRNNGGDRSGMVMVMTRKAVVVMVATGMAVMTVLMTGVAAMVTVITEMLVAICVAVVTVVGGGGDENSSWSGDDARKTNAVGSFGRPRQENESDSATFLISYRTHCSRLGVRRPRRRSLER